MNNPPRQLTHVRSAIYAQPWAIVESSLNAICEIAENHVAGVKPAKVAHRGKQICGECNGLVDIKADSCPQCGCEMIQEEELPPYQRVRGVAVLSLCGPLFPRANLMTAYSGATSYQEFGSAFDAAGKDDRVSARLILGDSPGGSCLGLSETCTKIFEARKSENFKPTIGLVNPQACSAAYAIMSQCEELYCTESSITGSIGVIWKSDNYDRAERNAGNDPTIMRSSELKAYEQPSSVSQYKDAIKMVEAYFGQFKEIVKRGRKGIDIESVATGECFVGREAVERGLVDGVSTFEKLISTFGT